MALVEIAAALNRAGRDEARALQYVHDIRAMPTVSLVALDDALAVRAVRLAIDTSLRGSDAVYAAVAEAAGTTLVSLDREHLARLPKVVPTVTPDVAVAMLAPTAP